MPEITLSSLIVIGANSDARDGLASGVGGALVVASLGRADQGAVGGLGRAGSLKDALGSGSGASRQIAGAGLGGGAVRRAEIASKSLDLNAQLVRQASIGLGITIVSGVGRHLDGDLAGLGVR